MFSRRIFPGSIFAPRLFPQSQGSVLILYSYRFVRASGAMLRFVRSSGPLLRFARGGA